MDWRSRMSTAMAMAASRSEEHTSELQSHSELVCRLLLEKKKPSGALRVAGDKLIPAPEVALARVATPAKPATQLAVPLYGWAVDEFVFFFNDTATTEIYTLSLHDALPI